MSSGGPDPVQTTRVHFSCGHARLAAGLPSTRASAWLDALLPHHQVGSTPPGNAGPEDPLDFSVEHTGEGWFVYDHGLLPAGRGPVVEAQAWGVLERALADRLALGLVSSLDPAVLLHAGGVATPDGAVLIAGASGSGKSSLVSAFGKVGVSVLGDDAVVLTTDGQIHAFKRPFKVHEGARQQLGLTRPSAEAVGSPTDPWLYGPEDLGSDWADATPLRHVVFAVRHAGIATTLDEKPPAVGTRRLLDLGLGPLERGQALARIVEGTRNARFWSLRFDRCDLARDVLTREFSFEA